MKTPVLHTPGPWKVSGKHTIGNDRGELVAEVMFAPDARLIAAAPALLEALEYAEGWADLLPEDAALVIRNAIALAKGDRS